MAKTTSDGSGGTKPPATTADPRTPETGGPNATIENPVADTDAALVAATTDGRTVPLEVPGPGVGAERIAEVGVSVTTTPVTGVAPRAPLVAPPTAAMAIDPSTVPGTRDLPAVTQVLFNGRLHEPGDTLRGVDFRTYSELVTIGAVVPIDWTATAAGESSGAS